MSDDKPFFLSKNSGFAQAVPTDELLHPERNALVKGDSVTETQYFGFCIPEQKIHGYCYLWHHPHLHIVSGGLFVWAGDNITAAHAPLCDYHAFVSDKYLDQDLHEYRLPNGYGVKVVDPLKRQHLTYVDAKRANAVDLTYEAVIPPVLYGDGAHFEQPTKVRGSLTLRGVEHEVDCFSVRDRSWGKPRPEENLPLPCVSWMQGVFTENFAFSCTILDQAAGNPELAASGLALPDEKTLSGGWIYRDGTLGRLTKATKRVVRQRGSRMPQSAELILTDEHDRQIKVSGTSIASIAWSPWTNLYMPIVLMRWECEGAIAHGDCQEGIWNDYLNLSPA